MSVETVNVITQERLREVLNYNPETGIFTWLVSVNNRVKAGDIAGSLNKISGYIHMTVNNQHSSAHRFAFMYMEGSFPPKEVDHINHIKHDNRWCNLRAVTNTENQQNAKLSKANRSGVTGIYWSNKFKKWHPQIRANGKRKSLGLFDSLFDAVCARKSAEKKHGFHENHGSITKELEPDVKLMMGVE